MPTTPVHTWTGAELLPVYPEPEADTLAVRLEVSTTYPAGQLLAEKTASPGTYLKYDSTLIANPAGAPTVGDGGAGALAAGTYKVGYSWVNANGETLMSPVGSVTLGASKQIAITAVTPLPTGVASVNWYMSVAPDSLVMAYVANNNGAGFNLNALPAAGAKAPPTASTAYLKTDGAATPKLLLRRACVTDAAGNITQTAAGGELGESALTTPAFYKGPFRTADLTGLDQRALDVLRARFLSGNLAAGGIIAIG